MKRKRGFTLIELLVVIAIIALLVGLLLPALAKARAKAKSLKDANQVKQLHSAMVTWSIDHDGIFPTPGLVDRIGTIPGVGPEDVELNDTANMYSLMIAQNSITPEICLSPVESSGQVAADTDYDWEEINIPLDIYWDRIDEGPGGFLADLDGIGGGGLSNTSYAHIPLAGERKLKEWRNTANSKRAGVGNRGVRCGTLDEGPYNSSLTLRFHGSKEQWMGNIAFMDNHVESFETFTPEGFSYIDQSGDSEPDNFFLNDIGGCTDLNTGRDNWLVIISEMSGDVGDIEGTLEWD